MEEERIFKLNLFLEFSDKGQYLKAVKEAQNFGGVGFIIKSHTEAELDSDLRAETRHFSPLTGDGYLRTSSTSKFDVKTLKPFDRVLTRRENATTWFVNLFSHLALRYDKFACANQHYYTQCVPFNEDTKYLLGTAENAPEFYKTWK